MSVVSLPTSGTRALEGAAVRALPPGQVVEGRIVAPLDNGLTRVAIGKTTVDLPLPPGLQPGQTVHLQARGSGPEQTLTLLNAGGTANSGKAAPPVLEGKVLSVLDNGLTRIAIGKTTVDVPLSPGAQPGQTVRLDARPAQPILPTGQTNAATQTLPPGSVAEAKVVSLTDNGLTRVAIGGKTVDVALPPGLQPGQSIRLLAQGTGAEQRLLPQVQTNAQTPVLKPGKTAIATVVGQPEAGITRLAIGKTTVDVAFPTALKPGQTLQVQATGSGANQSLAILGQSAPDAGRAVDATVVARLDNGLTRLTIGKTTVDLPLPPGLKPGQSLSLSIAGPGSAQAIDGNQRLALALQGVPAGAPQLAAANMILNAVGRQDGMSALFANLAALRQNGTRLPESVDQATQRVLDARVDLTGRPPTGNTLQQAIIRSGVFLESLLANGKAALTGAGPQPAPGGDLKSALLALKGSLEGWLGNEAKPQPGARGEPVRPPVRGTLPQAQSPALPTLPEGAGVRDIGRMILSQTEAALARVRLAQLSSLGETSARGMVASQNAPGEWNTEIPLLFGNETGMAQFQILRDGGHDGADGDRGWQMRFSIDFEATGGVHAKVTLRAGRVGVMLWADRPETSELLSEHMTDLSNALEAIGLKVGALHTRPGKPAEPKPPVGAFMDQVT